MKKHYTFILFAFFGLSLLILNYVEVTAQTPNYLWAKNAGGTSADQGRCITSDVSGNVLVTGYFNSPTINFGTNTLTNSGGADIFIVKYNPNGNVLWAKSEGGTGGDYGNSIATDGSGNVVVTGTFTSPSITFGTTTLTNEGSNDIFIVKYDSGGNVLWAKSAGGTSEDQGWGIAMDAGGNVVVTGYYRSSVITFETTTLTSGGDADIFIVKYDPGGNVIWTKSAGGTNADYGFNIATDGSGNLLITGTFTSPSITFETTPLNSAGSNDLFIVKYDPNGNVLWAKSAGGISFDDGSGVATDGSGNVLVTGYFQSTTMTFGATSITNAGSNDIFIVKYDSNGNVMWAKSAGGTSSDLGFSVASDASGNVLVTGRFTSPSITFGTTTLINAGSNDIFIVKYDSGGNVIWAKSAGGTSFDQGSSIAMDTGGNVLVTGYFQSPAITFGTTTLTNAGNNDILILKLGNVTGMEENTLHNEINVFPNPSRGMFNLEMMSSENLKVELVEVHNVMGVKVLQQPISNSSNFQIDLSSQPNGIYFLQIKTEWEFINKKLIIQK